MICMYSGSFWDALCAASFLAVLCSTEWSVDVRCYLEFEGHALGPLGVHMCDYIF